MSIVRKKLSDKVLKQARKDIGEDDSKKAQMLIQFREWIEKHPRIKLTRKGTINLIFGGSFIT
jgi:hypothetical protein